jgi:hypothetical protein
MTDAMIDDLLDELVPAVEQLPDWDGVLRRATRVRRRRVLTAVVLAALVLVPTAYAVARAFEGTPAPPRIRESFTRSNRMADLMNRYAVKHRFHAKVPHAIVASAHGVLRVQTSDGPLDLWAARSDHGGLCWFYDFEADLERTGPPLGGGSCDQGSVPPTKVDFFTEWTRAHPTLQTLVGRVFVPARSVRVTLSNGSAIRLPVVEGLYFGVIPNHVRFRSVVAFDARGRQVASFSVPGAR